MLIWFVVCYMAVSIGIGVWAATRVHSARDYAVAGRRMPFILVMSTVFATWFGAETVLGIPATFLGENLRGIVADPFGSSLCLILAGLFFATKLYRMNLISIGDYYRIRYNRPVEIITSIAIVLSYLGWVSAQLTALGLVFNVVSGGAMPLQTGILIGAAIMIAYTAFGGMFSVVFTDAFHMIPLVLGLIYLAWLVSGMAGGAEVVVEHARNAGKLEFWPKPTLPEILAFIGAAVTIMLGSIPQQDVFQRITSAKTERIALTSSVAGGSLYFIFAFIPIFLAYSATLIDPAMVNTLLAGKGDHDTQLILPTFILQHTPLFAQIVFFGALLSAITNTASATLLAPSVTFTENLLREAWKRDWTDRALLVTMRWVVLGFGTAVTLFALNSKASIFQMVENAYKITLVCAFIPLVMGIYWKRANSTGAMWSIVLGLSVWIALEITAPKGLWPPQLAGLLASFAGMLMGSLWSKPVVQMTDKNLANYPESDAA
jgi:SSS family solute:Na+ symporter